MRNFNDTSLEYFDKFYKGFFKKEHKCDSLVIGDNPEGMPGSLIMPSWMNYKRVWAAFSRFNMPCESSMESFLKEIDLTKEIRNPSSGSYVLAFNDMHVNDFTLLEAMVMILWYLNEYCHAMSFGDWKQCVGSRSLSGTVPAIIRNNRGMYEIKNCSLSEIAPPASLIISRPR